ncbi:MAG TPA: DUF5666 domain-containing protein [Burkholderiales bacterium]|nr:DUF5666 domain-containing protein [Burkholderiales bacterium]
MNYQIVRNLFALCALLLGLGACGGGEVASGGTGGTGISSGAITGFGSIFVNGVEFSTSSATIRRDDAPIGESELRKGMLVEVQGSIAGSTGSATRVAVEEAVRGPVESVAGTASAGTVVVLGQTVQVDDTTFFDDNVPDFGAIAPGVLLEVHGLRRSDGSIVASFVQRKTAPVAFTVRGVVEAHNAATQTFRVGALTVSYAGAAVNDMPSPSGSNWNGLSVEVKGTNCSGNPVCGTLTATKVEAEGLELANADRAEIEGFVTALVSSADFTLGTVRVVTTGATLFLGGLQEEIAVGVKLEVEGRLSGGVLTALKIEFKDSVKIESNATVSGSTLALEGLPGITVTVNAFTEFKNTTATTSNLGSLSGKSVRIRGRASGATSVIATEIEDRGNPDIDVILQANATDVADPGFTILGVRVDTTGLNDFRDIDDNPIGRAAFFAALAPNGGLVKAKGTLPGVSGNALAAGALQGVELED